LNSWYGIYADKKMKLREVILFTQAKSSPENNTQYKYNEALLEAFSELAPGQKEDINVNVLGQKLKHFIGRIENGYSLKCEDGSYKVRVWHVVKDKVHTKQE
jgi:hypothetical protein